MAELWVEYEGKIVGRAIPNDDGDRFAFEYATEWIERADAFPISVRLPVREELWPAERAHVYFANLLPEGPARRAVCDRVGVSFDNDVALLEALGNDTAGALRFVATDAEQSDEQRERRHISQSELEEWAGGAPAFPTDPDRAPRLSLAGAQHKTSVVETSEGYALPGWGEASTHILKFDSPDFPHLTANECLTTRFAEEMGLDVVDSHLDDRTSPPVLVVERYDRRSVGDGPVRRLHQEDFCQILGYLPSRKYESEGGPVLERIAAKLRAFSVRPAADVLELVRWVVFCALAGNADGHAKNVSLLYTDGGLSLAPAYDLVCTRAFPRLHRDLAFSIGGEGNPDALQREHWRAFAEDIGVKSRLVLREVEEAVERADDAFEKAVEQLREQIGESHAIQHVSKAVRKRVRAIGSHL